MNVRTTWVISALASELLFAVGASADLEAQYLGGGTKTAAEARMADLEDMQGKFMALGEAFPQELYEWRPMEGVRSVRDVLALVTVKSALFPTMWGFEQPSWVAEEGFQAETQRLNALSKEDFVTEIERSFGHLLGLLETLTSEDRQRQVNFFGLDVGLSTAIGLMANDMHEHLGQAIAYARMNRIVPPWSARS